MPGVVGGVETHGWGVLMVGGMKESTWLCLVGVGVGCGRGDGDDEWWSDEGQNTCKYTKNVQSNSNKDF